MNREQFRQRMKSLKSYRENNPGKGYWDWKVEQFQTGGEKHSNIVNGVRVNPYTGQPIATGAITPIINLEDAANFTPIGDALAIRDIYNAARNNDWLGLGLAGLGAIPYVPRVNRDYFARQFEEAIKKDQRRKQVVNDFYRQRNNTYEDLIENEDAFRRAANIDRRYGTNYKQFYQDAIKAYSKDSSPNNPTLPQMVFDRELYQENTKAQVDPKRLDRITINTRYADIDELDRNFQRLNEGLVRHEMGHIVDEKVGRRYVDRLSDPNRFVSEERIREMFPKSHRSLQKTVLQRGSEIKSYMNEFRGYLMEKGDYTGEKETVNSFIRKLDKYGKEFPTLRKIFDSYKSKKQFIKDYNTVPIVSTGSTLNNLA